MPNNNYKKEDILTNSKIGLEFEFFSKLSDKEILKSLSKLLNKRVVMPLAISALGQDSEPLYHSPVEVSSDIFKLEPDFSGGPSMYELVTGPLKYSEAINIIKSVFDWIDRYGYTTDRASIHANISFDYEHLNPTSKITELNVSKFILGFNEDFVYDRFPSRKNSVYARSIKSIIPNSFFYYKSLPDDGDFSNSVNLPNEKYFGVNFTKKEQDYLEFRYMGGSGYQNNIDKTIETINYFITHLFNSINNPELDKKETGKMNNIFQKHSELVKCFSRYYNFKSKYSDIIVSIDNNKSDQVVETYWNKIKDKLFSIMINGDFSKGRYNYDSDFGAHQLAEANLKECRLSGIDIVKCEIDGFIENCSIYYSTINNSIAVDCELIRENTCNDSKIENTILNNGNTLNNCYIVNPDKVINCEVNGGIIRKGEIGAHSTLDDKVIIVEKASTKNSNKKAPNYSTGKLKTKKWLKSLEKNKNKKADND